MLRYFLYILVIILVFASGFFLRNSFSSFGQKEAKTESVVLLEQIKQVSKWVSVEGYFSEIYDYKDYYTFDFFPFQKKALIRIKAKVLVGFDLNNWKIDADIKQRRITISPLPEPQILSIEHDLDYYDITEGTFNTFSADDYNKLNAKAKDFIRNKADQSDLKNRARSQGKKMIEQIRQLVQASGWELSVSSSPLKN
ncbi:MAG: DUF4230 domain-containing protein [Saprospiraceae bacterium]